MFSAAVTRRVLIGSAMLLFVAGAIVAPVAAAMSLCAMPCCHHGASPNGSLAAQFPCPFKCQITTKTDEVAAVAPQPSTVSAHATGAVASAEPAPVVIAQPIAAAGEAPLLCPRPLHILNSVFLI